MGEAKERLEYLQEKEILRQTIIQKRMNKPENCELCQRPMSVKEYEALMICEDCWNSLLDE